MGSNTPVRGQLNNFFPTANVEGTRKTDGKPVSNRQLIYDDNGHTPFTQELTRLLDEGVATNGGNGVNSVSDAMNIMYNNGWHGPDVDLGKLTRTDRSPVGDKCSTAFTQKGSGIAGPDGYDKGFPWFPVTDKPAGQEYIGGFQREATANTTNDPSNKVVIAVDEMDADGSLPDGLEHLVNTLDEHYGFDRSQLSVVDINEGTSAKSDAAEQRYTAAFNNVNGQSNQNILAITRANLLPGKPNGYFSKDDNCETDGVLTLSHANSTMKTAAEQGNGNTVLHVPDTCNSTLATSNKELVTAKEIVE